MTYECPHYRGEIVELRRPLGHERFKSRNCCVCRCGVCLGWLRGKMPDFNPVLNAAQREAVRRFLLGQRTPRQIYAREYYLRVVKPKADAARRARAEGDGR